MPTSDLVERLRAVKSPEEVAAIRAAAALAQDALAEVLPDGAGGPDRAGDRRRARGARSGGGAASGTRSRRSSPRVRGRRCPHARTSARDRRARGSGCCSTSAPRSTGTAPTSPVRWWWAARPTSGSGRSTTLVRERAAPRARRTCAPGMTGREADALAREVIAGRGFGEAFGHSLGHGLGPRSARGAAAGADRRGARCRRMRWSRSSRGSIFRAGAASGWRTTCTWRRRARAAVRRPHRAGRAGVAGMSLHLTLTSSQAPVRTATEP